MTVNVLPSMVPAGYFNYETLARLQAGLADNSFACFGALGVAGKVYSTGQLLNSYRQPMDMYIDQFKNVNDSAGVVQQTFAAPSLKLVWVPLPADGLMIQVTAVMSADNPVNITYPTQFVADFLLQPPGSTGGGAGSAKANALLTLMALALLALLNMC